MKLSRLERRLGQAILEAFAPPTTREGLVPRAGEVDYLAALELMGSASTPRARIGMRAALWIVAFAPIFMLVSFRTMAGLSIERRAALLDRMLASHVFLVRELALIMKIAASFAMMATRSVRARCGYDRTPGERSLVRHVHTPHETPEGDTEPVRPRRPLPLLRPSRSGAM